MDLANGCFEFGGALFLLLNVIRLFKDKRVAGVSVATVAFFGIWGVWNLFYYPSLEQWASFVAGIAVVIANSAWVVLALYYKFRKEAHQ